MDFDFSCNLLASKFDHVHSHRPVSARWHPMKLLTLCKNSSSLSFSIRWPQSGTATNSELGIARAISSEIGNGVQKFSSTRPDSCAHGLSHRIRNCPENGGHSADNRTCSIARGRALEPRTSGDVNSGGWRGSKTNNGFAVTSVPYWFPWAQLKSVEMSADSN
jgi:hypothetical protein